MAWLNEVDAMIAAIDAERSPLRLTLGSSKAPAATCTRKKKWRLLPTSTTGKPEQSGRPATAALFSR